MIRLAGQSCDCIVPFECFPQELQCRVDGGYVSIDGGAMITGAELAPLDEERLRDVCKKFLKDAPSDKSPIEVAIVATFACSTPAHELRAERLCATSLARERVSHYHIASAQHIC